MQVRDTTYHLNRISSLRKQVRDTTYHLNRISSPQKQDNLSMNKEPFSENLTQLMNCANAPNAYPSDKCDYRPKVKLVPTGQHPQSCGQVHDAPLSQYIYEHPNLTIKVQQHDLQGGDVKQL
ncbi:hypothetical protein DPMN_020523 [Dreissena polymorpha]|uniref:Uncharacterized protein n=1 Tax=Dreissena polymorpha TaxID=45954 RepID=A0A9D4NGY8_DREPO|nr:hypothetical protein DPMN_020523 [Dreissena polymorpha]